MHRVLTEFLAVTDMLWVVDESGRTIAVLRGSDESPAESGVITIVRSTSNDPDRPTWMSDVRAAWEARAAALELAGERLAILPRAIDIISDIPSTLTFLRARPDWGLVLEPAALLTGAMLAAAEDHLGRIAILAGHPACVGLVLPSPEDPLRPIINRLFPSPATAWVAEHAPAVGRRPPTDLH